MHVEKRTYLHDGDQVRQLRGAVLAIAAKEPQRSIRLEVDLRPDAVVSARSGRWLKEVQGSVGARSGLGSETGGGLELDSVLRAFRTDERSDCVRNLAPSFRVVGGSVV